MLFKTESDGQPKIQRDWLVVNAPMKLRLYAAMLDVFVIAETGEELVITDFLRDHSDTLTYHDGRAIDYRTKDWSHHVRVKIEIASRALISLINEATKDEPGELQLDTHQAWTDPYHEMHEQRHHHVEVDDGNPVYIQKGEA